MKRNKFFLVLALFLMLALVACGTTATEAPPAAEPTEAMEEPEEEMEEPEEAMEALPITAWSHSAGNPDEISVVKTMIADYNASQDKYEVILEEFPQGLGFIETVGLFAGAGLPHAVSGVHQDGNGRGDRMFFMDQ